MLKNPKYAVMGDLKPVEAPEASSSRTMHPIEVKIEEADTSGTAAGAPSALGESNMETAVKRVSFVDISALCNTVVFPGKSRTRPNRRTSKERTLVE